MASREAVFVHVVNMHDADFVAIERASAIEGS
jgi:hypothetical protein